MESQSDKEERVLQYEVSDNLEALMADIRATDRDLNQAVRSRDLLLQTSNVNWSKLVEHDSKIESYQRGLDRLKSYRNRYFPNWKQLTTEI